LRPDTYAASKPTKPTRYQQGTPEYLEVMAGRARRHQQLRHPADGQKLDLS
jgi:hypothetical protein